MEELTEYEEIKKDKSRSPFIKWVQVNNSNEAYQAEDWLISKSPIAYRILKFLVSKMDKYNAVVVSYKVMAEIFGYSRVTLSEAIKLLKEHNFIDIKKSGTSNVYLLNKTLYWNSWGKNYAHAEFGAKIIISSTEQDKEEQKKIQLQLKRYQHVEAKEDSAKIG